MSDAPDAALNRAAFLRGLDLVLVRSQRLRMTPRALGVLLHVDAAGIGLARPLAEIYGVCRANTARTLLDLRDAGLLVSRRAGMNCPYSLTDAGVAVLSRLDATLIGESHERLPAGSRASAGQSSCSGPGRWTEPGHSSSSYGG